MTARQHPSALKKPIPEAHLVWAAHTGAPTGTLPGKEEEKKKKKAGVCTRSFHSPTGSVSFSRTWLAPGQGGSDVHTAMGTRQVARGRPMLTDPDEIRDAVRRYCATARQSTYLVAIVGRPNEAIMQDRQDQAPQQIVGWLAM